MTDPLTVAVGQLLDAAVQRAQDRISQDLLRQARERLDRPLRLAFAGRVKAGKSTLLNALIGEELAPTDAGECTRLVTWYVAADSAEALVHHHDGRVEARPSTWVPRSSGSTTWRSAGRQPGCASSP
jgi:ATPase subunit of ABC transporter with duplicated ATPase domains